MSEAGGDHYINNNEWEDPFSRQLREILSIELKEFLRLAIEMIVDLGLGYTKESAEQLILRCGLYHGFKDVTSNAVEGAMAFVRDGMQSGPEIFNDLGEFIDYCLNELVNVVCHCKSCASVFEAMWCLLLCDLNFWHAVSLSSDQLSSASIKDISSTLSEEDGLKEDLKEAFYSQHISKLMDFKKPVTRELQSPNMNDVCARNVSREESSLPPFLKSGDASAMFSRMTAVKNETKHWTDWANEKMMQATKRLGKECSELKILRQRKEASKGVEEAKEKIRSTDLLKVALQEEFAALRHRKSNLLSQLKIARGREKQHEVLRKRDEAEKLKYNKDAMQRRIETESLKADTKVKEVNMREETESLKRRSLSSESPRLQVDCGGGKGGFSSSSIENLKASSSRYIEAGKTLMTRFEADNSMTPERECIICLSEEACVVLLPCAHMVLCKQCNVILEEQGISDCPTCRKQVMMRVTVRSVDD